MLFFFFISFYILDYSFDTCSFHNDEAIQQGNRLQLKEEGESLDMLAHQDLKVLLLCLPSQTVLRWIFVVERSARGNFWESTDFTILPELPMSCVCFVLPSFKCQPINRYAKLAAINLLGPSPIVKLQKVLLEKRRFRILDMWWK